MSSCMLHLFEDLYLHLDTIRLPLGLFYLETLKHIGYKEERTKTGSVWGWNEQSSALPVEWQAWQEALISPYCCRSILKLASYIKRPPIRNKSEQPTILDYDSIIESVGGHNTYSFSVGELYLEMVLPTEGDGLLIAASSRQNCLSVKIIGHISHCVHCHSIHIPSLCKAFFISLTKSQTVILPCC